MASPKQIKRNGAGGLSIVWTDGHEGPVSLRNLRDNCPCAGCKGETVLLRTYRPEPAPDLPGKYELRNLQQVGSYAVQVEWGDGHSTGLYTWEKLRSLCECAECSPQ